MDKTEFCTVRREGRVTFVTIDRPSSWETSVASRHSEDSIPLSGDAANC